MGTVFTPNQKVCKFCNSQYSNGKFDINYAGKNLMASVYNRLGLRTINCGDKYYPKYIIPYYADEDEALKISLKISELTDSEIADILRDNDPWRGSKSNFVDWLRSWAKFLKYSKGYKVIL